MSTITAHTTRANGTILTAAIYNADHNVHVANANNLDADKIEGATPPVVDGHAVLFSGTSGAAIKSAGAAPFISGGTDVPVADGGTGASDAATARTNLGLVIGTDVQAFDQDLADIVGLTTAQGDLLYRGSSAWANLAAGTSGQFLQTQGSGANPQWAYSGMTLLTSGSVSSASSLDIVLTSYTGFRVIKIVVTDLRSSTDNVALFLRTSTDGGSTFDAGASNYRYNFIRAFASNFLANLSSAGATAIQITDSVGSDSTDAVDLEIKINEPTRTTARIQFEFLGGQQASDSNETRILGGGRRDTSADIDAVRLLMSSGNIGSCNYAVYGLA